MTAHSDGVAATLQSLGAQWLVRGWLSSNNIIFADGDEGAAVVDTGYSSHAGQTLALVSHALAGRPLARIVNSHLHSDHCGGNAELARSWPGLRTAVPFGYRASVQPWDESRLSFLRCDQRCEAFEVDNFLAPGATIRLGHRHWEIHATPGHDPDAVVFFEPQSAVLISADALWEDRLAIIFPELVGEPGFDAAHAALDLIERLAPRLVLPGHGAAFTGVGAALHASRSRLDAFAAAPGKHRLHAARALVSYHMLEHRQLEREALIQWIVETPIFLDALQCTGEPVLARQLAEETVERLMADGVLRPQGDMLEMVTRS